MNSNMMKAFSVFALTLALALTSLLSGCESKKAEKAPAEIAGVPFDIITMTRISCLENCPYYIVEIRASGETKYNGVFNVKVKGMREGKVDSHDVALLSAALRHVDFPKLKDHYQSSTDGCEHLPKDSPPLSIEVIKDGVIKKVEFSVGCRGPGVPGAGLAWLAQTIDEMAGVEQYVGM
jgi:hypothetical protein